MKKPKKDFNELKKSLDKINLLNNTINKELDDCISNLIKPFTLMPFDDKDVKKILNKSKGYHLIEGLKIPLKIRKKATGAIIFIIGGQKLTIEEINNASAKVTESLNEEADITWGARIDKNQKETMVYNLIIE